MNRYTFVGGTRQTYDRQGNLIKDGLTQYWYDAANRLTQYISGDTGKEVRFQYGPLGRRVRKQTDVNDPSKDTLYWYDGDEVVEETDAAGNLQREYVYGEGIDQVLRVRSLDFADSDGDDSTSDFVEFYYHTNSIGTVVALTDASGGVVERYEYGHFGELEKVTSGDGTTEHTRDGKPYSPSGNEYFFQGRRLDPETGLYYFRARYYNAAIGRFLSRDPLLYVDGMNPYQAFGGNPVNMRDPMGEYGEQVITPGWGTKAYVSSQGRLIRVPLQVEFKLTRLGNLRVRKKDGNYVIYVGRDKFKHFYQSNWANVYEDAKISKFFERAECSAIQEPFFDQRTHTPLERARRRGILKGVLYTVVVVGAVAIGGPLGWTVLGVSTFMFFNSISDTPVKTEPMTRLERAEFEAELKTSLILGAVTAGVQGLRGRSLRRRPRVKSKLRRKSPDTTDPKPSSTITRLVDEKADIDIGVIEIRSGNKPKLALGSRKVSKSHQLLGKQAFGPEKTISNPSGTGVHRFGLIIQPNGTVSVGFTSAGGLPTLTQALMIRGILLKYDMMPKGSSILFKGPHGKKGILTPNSIKYVK